MQKLSRAAGVGRLILLALGTGWATLPAAQARTDAPLSPSGDNPPAHVVFIDTAVPDSAQLAAAIRPGLQVVRLDPQHEELPQMTAALTRLAATQRIASVHLISHGAPGNLWLGSERLTTAGLRQHAADFRPWRTALTTDAGIYLYGCNLAANREGREFIRQLARVTGASVAASTDLTGDSRQGGNWQLEAFTGKLAAAAIFQPGFEYAGVLAADKTYTPPPSVFVRPGGTSYRWNFGTGTTPDPNYPGTYPVTSVGYYNVPAFNWVVTRGHFEYTSNGGTSWTTYTMGTSPTYISNTGTLWRFVDTSPSDPTNNNSFGTSWNLQGPTSSVQSGGTIIPDNPPTDITSDKSVILSAAGPGDAVAILTPTDTGSTVGGYWAIDSQSVSGLFTLTNNAATGNTATLILGSGTLPAIGQSATVTAHYYDLYQTDTNGVPLSGDGFSKTLTFTVVAESTSDLNFSSDLAVNTYTTNDQSHPAIATLSDGNFVVTWESAGQNGKDLTPNVNHGIYGQLYSATGSKVGGEFVISSSGHAVDEIEPAVTPLNSGRYAVTYRTAGTDYDIAFRLVETNGTVGAQHIANTTTAQNQYNPGIATLTDGSFVIVWGSDDGGIRLQHFSGTDGSAIGSEVTINTNGYSPTVAGLSNGSYAVSWADGNTYDIMVQVGAAGSPVDTGVGWSAYSIAARIAPLASGFVVAMEAYDTGTSTAQIDAARFNNSGVLQGSVFRVNTHTGGNRYAMAAAQLSGGGFVITWTSDTDDYDHSGVFGRRFAANGTAVDGADFEVNQHRTGDQSSSVVTGLAGDLFASAWTDIPDASVLDSSYIGDVEARVLLPSNTAPTVNVNAGLTLNEGTIGTLSATVLDFNDAEQADTAITYTLNTAPANGQLLLNGIALAVNDTFTQDDLDHSRLQYAHDGSDTTSDSFTFTVSDGAGGNVSGQTFNFTVSPVNDATTLASAPIITFTNAPGGAYALDGQGGSTDVAGIALETYFADGSLNPITTNNITYEDPYAVGAADSGLAINYNSSAGSDYVIIKSRNPGDNFWLQSLQLSDYGGNDVKIEAFDNGVSQGSVNVTVNTDPFYFTFDQNGALTPTIFHNVDEIRISGQAGGVIWLTVNNIQIAAPVNNQAPTDEALSNASVNESAGVNATVGTLSTTDANAGDSHTYSLVTGTGDDNNSAFNISGNTLRANDASTLPGGNYSVRIQTDDGNGGTFAKSFTIGVVDDLAPAAPTSFSAGATSNNVALAWVNPANADFASVTIRRSPTGFPATITDGTLVASGVTGTSQPDDGLADGTYYYAIFALDGTGNVSLAATASVTVDTVAPTLVIGAPSVTNTVSGPVDFTITYTGADTVTLASGAITLNQTGTANATSIVVSGSGTTNRTVTLSGISGSGTLGISIAAGTASDTAGNTAAAAGPSATFVANAVPVVGSDNATVTVGEGATATNTGTFSDADGNATVTLTASVGTVTPDNNAGTWSWSLLTTNGPAESQTVTITADDGVAPAVTTTFDLVVTNVPPTVTAQAVTTPEDTATNITLTATDPGTDSITNWVVTAGPTNGTLSGTAPNLTYTPATNFNGADAFSFTATDSDGATSAVATVSLTVTPVNDPPVAGADSLARLDNTKLVKVTKTVLLANDTDPDNDPLSIAGVGNALPAGATVTMVGNFVTYTAPATNAGDGSFTYTLSDGPGGHFVTNTVPVIQIASTPTGAGPNYAAIAPSGSDYVLTFIGVPSHTYRVQYTTSASAPYTWNEFSPLVILTAPANGVFQYTDTNPPGPLRLYRAVPHP